MTAVKLLTNQLPVSGEDMDKFSFIALLVVAYMEMSVRVLWLSTDFLATALSDWTLQSTHSFLSSGAQLPYHANDIRLKL